MATMHWLTAVAALLGFYSVAGALYSISEAPPDQVMSGVRVWAVMFVIAIIIAAVNQWRLRRNKA